MKKILKRIAVIALALVLVCCGAGTVTVDADGTSGSTSQGVSFNDSQFDQYHNKAAEATLGTAGDFGLIAFDTLTLYSHTNTNFAADKFIANNNGTGTKNYGPEVNYIHQISDTENYNTVGRTGYNKANICDDILAVGSTTVDGNTVSKEDNNLLIKKAGTDQVIKTNQMEGISSGNLYVSDNFIDLGEVRQEIVNKQNQFASNETSDSSLVETYLGTKNGQDQNNQRIIVNGSGKTAYLNLNLDSSNLLTKVNTNGTTDSSEKTVASNTPLRIYLNSADGKYNNLVINVDASSAGTDISFPQIEVYYGSGDPLNGGQYTKEVTSEQTDKEGSKFNSHVVLNFKNVTNKNITFDKTENAAILATDANVTFASNINGKVVANKIDAHGEFHRNDFIMEAIHDSFNVTKTFAPNVETRPVSVKVGLYKADKDSGAATGEPIQTQIIKISGDGPYTTTFTGLDPNTRYVAKEISYKMSGDSDYTGIDAADSKYKPQYGTAEEAEPKNAASATDNTVTAKTSSGSGTQYSDTIGNSSKGTYGPNRTRKQWTVNKTFKDSSKASNVKSITVQLFKYNSKGKKEAVKDKSGNIITETIEIKEKNNVYSGSLTYKNSSLPDLNEGEYYRFDEISYTTKNPEKTIAIGSDDSDFTASVNDPNPTSNDTANNTETITNHDATEITVTKIVKSGDGTTLNANDVPTSVTFNIYRNENGQKTFVRKVDLKDFTQDNHQYTVSKTIKGLPAGNYTAEEDGYTIGGSYVKIENSKKYTPTSETSTDANRKKTVTVTNTTPSIIKTGIRTTTDAVGLAVILASAGLVIALAIRSKMLNRA